MRDLSELRLKLAIVITILLTSGAFSSAAANNMALSHSLVAARSLSHAKAHGERWIMSPPQAETGIQDPGVLMAVAHAGTSGAVSQDSEEKKRVPKKKKKTKQASAAAEDEEEDDDDDESCWSSCFSGVLLSLFDSSDDEEELVQDPVYPGAAGLAPEDTVASGEPTPIPEPGEQVLEVVEAPELPPFRNRLLLTGSLGWGMMGPSDVLDEYRDGAWRVELNSFWATTGTFQVGMALGYQTARGYPQFDYETPSRLDSPGRSRLRMFNASLRAGQYVSPVRRSARIYWGVGPGIFWVRESADLEVFAVAGGEFLREEDVSLEKWRIGGDAAFGMDWPLDSDARIGFLTRVYFIPWEGSREKSLTLDFIGKRTIVGFNIGVTIAYDRL